jgi:hypothetical protein
MVGKIPFLISIFFVSTNITWAQQDSIFMNDIIHVGEIFYVGQSRVIYENKNEVNIELPTADITEIKFKTPESEISKEWQKVLINRNELPNSNPSEFSKDWSISDTMITFLAPNIGGNSKFNQELRLSSYYLKKSADNQRNMFISGLVGGLGLIGWSSQINKVAIGQEPSGTLFFAMLTIGGGSITFINYLLSISNLKQSGIHLEAAADYAGLSLVIPLNTNTRWANR